MKIDDRVVHEEHSEYGTVLDVTLRDATSYPKIHVQFDGSTLAYAFFRNELQYAVSDA